MKSHRLTILLTFLILFGGYYFCRQIAQAGGPISVSSAGISGSETAYGPVTVEWSNSNPTGGASVTLVADDGSWDPIVIAAQGQVSKTFPAVTTTKIINYRVQGQTVGSTIVVLASITKTQSSFNSLTLTWGTADSLGGSPVTGYVITRNDQSLATATSGSYADTGLAPSTSYNYKVTAISNGVALGFTDVASVSTDALPVPTAPTGLTTKDLGNTKDATGKVTGETVELDWLAGQSKDRVATNLVYANGKKIDSVAGTSYVFYGVPFGVAQSYTVVAQDGYGQNSPQSSPATITVPIPATPTPTPSPSPSPSPSPIPSLSPSPVAATVTTTSHRNNTPLYIAIALLALAGLGYGGWQWWLRRKSKISGATKPNVVNKKEDAKLAEEPESTSKDS